MILPEHLSPATFLEDFWQKKPLYLAQAIETALPMLDRDEMGWLATQADVESRIVFTEQTDAGVTYSVEHGPFSETYLNKLPTENWTLLVQDVEKHLPDFKVWFEEVNFIPRWRFDDLMVSFAAPGGSVGPHRDNYDVFLCQGEGCREWRINTEPTLPVDESATQLSLLQPFDAALTQRCGTGDVLYLPPQTAHWGIATSGCTTYSIGMRAPTRAELAVAAERLSVQETTVAVSSGDASACFYTDKDLTIDEVDGQRISHRSLQRLREQGLIDAACDDKSAALILCSALTDPKAWLDPESPSRKSLHDALQQAKLAPLPLQLHGMANLAWYADTALSVVGVNGHSRLTNQQCRSFFQQICAAHEVAADAITGTPEGTEFLRWLLENATFDLAHEQGADRE